MESDLCNGKQFNKPTQKFDFIYRKFALKNPTHFDFRRQSPIGRDTFLKNAAFRIDQILFKALTLNGSNSIVAPCLPKAFGEQFD